MDFRGSPDFSHAYASRPNVIIACIMHDNTYHVFQTTVNTLRQEKHQRLVYGFNF